METFRRHRQAGDYLVMLIRNKHNRQQEVDFSAGKDQHKHSGHQLEVICLGKLLLHSKWVKVHNLNWIYSEQLSLNQVKHNQVFLEVSPRQIFLEIHRHKLLLLNLLEDSLLRQLLLLVHPSSEELVHHYSLDKGQLNLLQL